MTYFPRCVLNVLLAPDVVYDIPAPPSVAVAMSAETVWADCLEPRRRWADLLDDEIEALSTTVPHPSREHGESRDLNEVVFHNPDILLSDIKCLV